ncbi:unnamed protein product [Gongylonema pulchrum]|uniref:Protein kinase domain-containing protein n=1 Tax=Gongylonema pulchrum TaxID=637853 RepID=A0A183EUE6_9BILA|nr:unnamed protein product [Gongylonema pulchrum]
MYFNDNHTETDVVFAARVLVYDMLRKEPSKRPTAEQLLRVPLMVEEDSSKLDAVVPLGPDSLGETKQIASGATSAFGSNDADESAREFLALLLSANEDQVVPSISTTFRIVIQRDV